MNNKNTNITSVQTQSVSPKDLALQVIRRACCYYTVFTIVFILIRSMAVGSWTEAYINNISFIMLFPFALMISLGTIAFRNLKSSIAVRYFIHFVCFFAGFLIGAYLPYKISFNPTGRGSLVIISLVLIGYAIWLTIHAVINRKKRIAKQEEIPYVSQFSVKR